VENQLAWNSVPAHCSAGTRWSRGHRLKTEEVRIDDIRKRIFFTPLMFVMLLGVSSCATVGHDFPVGAISQIQIGKTSRQEVNNIFWSPWRVGWEDGERTWTYGYYK
jgi:hypothetical protein